MSETAIGILGLVALLVLLGLGIPIGFAGFMVGLVGLMVLTGPQSLSFVGSSYFDITAAYDFSVLPLFVIMGGIVVASGVMPAAYEAARRFVGHLPGGLVAATTIAGALFGAACGSSTASTATLTKLAAPEMKAAGYSPRTAAAAIASLGGLAIMIPPSSAMVIYGIITGTSIPKLLIAGILPGILNTAIFIGLAVLMGLRRPAEMPALPRATWIERFRALPGTAGILFVGAVVVGTIYAGVATPTEAASLGVAAALLLAIVRRVRGRALLTELGGAASLTCKMFLIVAGMIFFARFIALTGIPRQFATSIVEAGLPVPLFLLAITVLYLILGMFLDGMGVILLSLPFIFPAVVGMGLDPVWFGVCLVLLVEIGLITPPVGVNVFVVQAGMPELRLEGIFGAILPFFLGFLLTLLILYAFPAISLFLPNLMG